MRKSVSIPADKLKELDRLTARRERARRQLAVADEAVKAWIRCQVAAGFGPRPIGRALGLSPSRAVQLIAAATQHQAVEVDVPAEPPVTVAAPEEPSAPTSDHGVDRPVATDHEVEEPPAGSRLVALRRRLARLFHHSQVRP